MPSVVDLAFCFEACVVIIVTWLLLGWMPGEPITQGDGTWLVAPYTDSALAAGTDWSDHLYRFGVIGGSEMHPFGGTTPLVQLASLLGLSTTTTLNLTTFFIQLCFAVLGGKLAHALAGAERPISPLERIVAVWLCGFAPLLGWRLGIGHENLLEGLLPLVALVSLLWCAARGTLTITLIALGSFATMVGVSGLGEQMLVYGAVFGAPLVVATLVATRCRQQWLVVCALGGAVLVMLPRLVPVLEHAFGDDTTRGFGTSVVYAMGEAQLADFAKSLLWAAAGDHERNYPVGALVIPAIALWPRAVPRHVGYVLVASLAVAIAFACGWLPLADVLPPLSAFRVPARAAMPIVIFVPAFALAWAWRGTPILPQRMQLLGVLGAVVLVVAVRERAPWVVEAAAWVTCAAFIIPRTRHPLLLPAIAALGVCAFCERIPLGFPRDPIERGPRALRLAVEPELRSALDRVVIIDAPPPYQMSAAFAARIPSLDGVWYPPRRFHELLSEIQGRSLDTTTAVFSLGRTRAFLLLQQLYNVRFALEGLDTGAPSLRALPATPGPAWFPASIEQGSMIEALKRSHDFHADLLARAWATTEHASRCAGARVVSVATDDRGQRAEIVTQMTEPCTLVVATNYVASLRGTATVEGARTPVRVFPINIALTGIALPGHTTAVTLEPAIDLPAWSRVAQLLGALALLAVGYFWSLTGSSRSNSPTSST